MADLLDSNKTIGDFLNVSSEYISFLGTVIPTKNISRLRSYEFSQKRETAIFYAVLSIAAIVGAAILANKNYQLFALLVGGIAILFIIAAAHSFFFKRYGISIETNGGTRDFIISRNKKFAQEVLSLILETMAKRDRSVSYNINMDNRTITKGDFISQSGIFGIGVDKRNT